MTNQEGSMGTAIVIGFVAFMVLNALLGAILPYCMTDYLGQSYCYSMGISGALIGSVMLGWGMLFLGVFSFQFIGAILAALIAGMLAGIVAKGSGGRGFMAGFGASMIGYFLMLLIAFIIGIGMYSGVPAEYGAYGYGSGTLYYGSFVPGLNAQFGGMGGMGMNNLMASGALLLIGIFIIIPIASGVIAGIGGMIMSSLFAKPATATQQSAPIISTVVQAGPGYAQPQYQQPVQQSVPAPAPTPTSAPTPTHASSSAPVSATAPMAKAKPAASTVKAKADTKLKASGKLSCPKCGKENAADATFCEECGTRLKA